MRAVGLSPASIGLLMVGPGLGAVLGAALASRIAGRIGRVRTVLAARVVMGGASLLIPLAATGPRLAFYIVGAASGIVLDHGGNVTSVSLRQIICPDEMLGG